MQRLILGSVRAACGVLMIGLTATAGAQTFPTKPVRIVVPYSAATATDSLVRLVAERLAVKWQQGVYVENVPGLNGVVGTRAYLRGPRDGHTLIALAASHLLNAAVVPNLQFDTLADFQPITNLAAAGFVLVTPASSPYKSVADLVKAAKADPGKLNYGSTGIGTPAHVIMALALKQLDANVTHIPYKTAAQGLIGVLAGEVDAYFIVVSAAVPHVQSGKLRALATTFPGRNPKLPDVPALAEVGMPGFQLVSWFGLAGYAGLPKETVEKINADVTEIMQSQELLEKVANLGLEPMVQGPASFAQTMKTDLATYAEMVKASGAKLGE